MKILITGGAGFIGSHVVERYQGRADITVLDNLRTGHASNLAGFDGRVVEGSILDRKLLAELMVGVDYVFHLAAMVSVPESMAKPHETVELNVTGLLNVLEAARSGGVKKLVFASSAAVYGENPSQPKVETQTPDPRSPYAITKLDGEYYCALYDREGWLPTACLRFFNVFGQRQDPKSAYAAAVPIFLAKALANEPLIIFGDGGQTRDFIFVKDIVGALSFVAESADAKGVFNVGYGGAMSVLEIANEILRLTGSRSEIQFAPIRPGDLRHSTADASKLQQAGWKATYDVPTGLQELICRSLTSTVQRQLPARHGF
ncbi:MAG: NAD-dependent epimerase/dehydratase family protein [Terrimicrobiaceae bacterium]